MKMNDSLLAPLSKADVEELPVDEIQVLDELQMRRPDAMSSKARAEDATARQRLIDDIAKSLLDDAEFESMPIKVVVCMPESDDCGWGPEVEVNCLVDGFHRLAAYTKAKRKTIRTQRVKGEWSQAKDVATIQNNHSKTVPVDPSQQRQQAWELVNRHLDRDLEVLVKPWSARSIARNTRVNHQTVNTMVKRAIVLGSGSGSMHWREARSDRQPYELSELDRTRHLLQITMELIDKAQNESELGVMLRVLQDEADGNLGYDLDVDEYADRLLAINMAGEEEF